MKNFGDFYDLTSGSKVASAGSNSLEDGLQGENKPNEYQTAVIYDLLSEGPIEGLVGGTDGIYLNDTPATIGAASAALQPNISDSVDFTASTNTVVDNNASPGLFYLMNVSDGTRYIRIVGAKKALSGQANISKGSVTLDVVSNFFDSTDAPTPGNPGGFTSGTYINIAGAGPNGSTLITRIQRVISATQIQINNPAKTTVSGADITLDKIGRITTVTNSYTAVIADVNGSAARDVSGVKAYTTSPARPVGSTPIYNHEKFQYAFMKGYRHQPYLPGFRGTGSASIVHSVNQEVVQTDLSSVTGNVSNVTSGGYTTASGNAVGSPITISASTMGINNQPEVDKLKLTFKIPTLLASKKKNGDETVAHVELRIYLGYKRAGDSSFTEVLIFGPTDAQIQARPAGRRTSNFEGIYGINNGFIQAETKAPFLESFTINLAEFQPFTDFQVKVERVNPTNARHGDYDHTNPCTFTTIEAIIEDRLSYPYSAYAAVIFDAQNFASLPSRAYKIKGLKIQVPTNYFPRGEKNASSGVRRTLAEYDRNVTTGADMSGVYQNWDGNFRGDVSVFNASNSARNNEKVWCDNPAWVFYDLVTNNRYGVGKYISKDQIDKYELFKIARYCDELVSDGQGGTEPRFTCNLYLQESAEALKVLKDVTSVFRGMMYWLDGEIQFSQNRYKSPAYTFSKGNVIGGLFSYTSSKEQYRSNQIRVTWNDPESMYKQAVEIVEDNNNILKTGRIVSKDVVAFGCTSRGQAHRFGKWHLLTEILETEAITFSTSINAGFLKPGDVVFIQDADVDDIRYSGRVSSSSTTTSINIDSAVDLSSGNTFKLSIVYPEGGAYLEQDSATINSISYVRGDYVPQATVDGSLVSLNSSARAYNAVDDSGNALDLNYEPYSRVETQTITSTGASTTAVAVSSAFSSAPESDYMWAIREYTSDGVLAGGSAKQYVITSINESQPAVYEIAAIEYEATKFDLVDRGYILDVGVDTNKPPTHDEEVPKPKSVTLSIKKNTNSSPEDDTEVDGGASRVLHIAWQHPTSERSGVESKYEYISHYVIRHNVNGKFQSVKVGKDDTSYDIPVTRYGNYTIQVRLVNTSGIKSGAVQRKIQFNNASAGISAKSRIGLLPLGGQFNQAISIDGSTGLLQIGSSTYTFISANGDAYKFTSTGTGNYQQSFSGMGASATAYLVFDADATSDHLKGVQVLTDTTAEDADGNNYNFEYIGEIGASNSGISSATGTVSIDIEENLVTGSSTTFRTDYSVGGRFIVDSGTDRFFATITSINSDTELEIDNIVPRAYSGASIFKLSYQPNFTKDTICAEIVTDGSTNYSLNQVYAITAGIQGADGADGSDGTDARAVDLTAGTNIFTYNASGTTPDPTSTTVTATAKNTSGTVYYRFLVNNSQVQHTTTNTYTYTPQSNISSMPDQVEVEIREGSTSGTVLARDQITMGGIKPGADGTDGVDGGDGVDALSTFYSNQAHTVPVTNTGTETWTGSGGDLNIFEGTTELILNSNTQTTSYPGSNGRYNLNITKVSGDTLTEGTITGSGTAGATIGDFSGNLTQATQYEISAYVKAADGTQYNPKFKISFSPSFEGADGQDGTDGTDGDNGLRTATGNLYYQSESSSAPSAPSNSGVTFTFSTGAMSGGVIGTGSTNWNIFPPTATGGSGSSKTWFVTYNVTESSAGSGTGTPSFGSTVRAATSFTGLVTFSSGDFVQNGSTITTIDGGNISAGSTITVGTASQVQLQGNNNRILITDSS